MKLPMRSPFFAPALCWILTGLILSGAAGATPESAAQGAGDAPSIDVIRQHADELSKSSGVDETTKSLLSEFYRRAISSLETAAVYRENIKGFASLIQTGPSELKSLRADIRLASDAGPSAPLVSQGLSLAEIELQLQQAEADRAAEEAGLAELKARVDKERDRPIKIRERLSRIRGQIVDNGSQALAPPGAGQTPEVATARRWAKESELELWRTEVLMLEQDLASHPIRLKLLQARLDLGQTDLASLQRLIRQLEAAANVQRLAAAEQVKLDAQVAERAAASKHPLVADLAARNRLLSEQIDQIAGAIQGVERQEQQMVAESKRIEESFTTTQQKTEVAGLSQILGQVLQEQRRVLPSPDRFRKAARDLEGRIAETTLSQILLEEERGQLRDLPTYVDELARAVSPEDRSEVVEELNVLALTRSSLVEQALAIQRTFLQSLSELDFAQRRLADVVVRFDAFLDKRLLWVRSSQVVGLDSIRLIPGQLANLLSPSNWLDVVGTLIREVARSLSVYLALLFALWVWLRRLRLRRVLRDSGDNVRIIQKDRARDTLRACAAVVLLASPTALLMFTIGRELQAAYEASEFTVAIGYALATTAPLLFQLQALRLFAAPRSIAAVHFGWHAVGLKRLRRDLRWVIPTLTTLALLTALTMRLETSAWGSGLGRGMFVVLMLAFSVFFFRLSHPTNGVISTLSAHNPEGLVYQLRLVWVLVLVGSPLIVGLIALAGFTYTAGVTIEHILESISLVLLLIVVHQLIVRWLVLNQRRLRLQAILAKRKVEQEARESKGTSEDPETAALREVEEPSVDYKALDATSRKLTNNAVLLTGLVGFWLIWQDMFPALGILDDVTLWTYTKSGVEDPIPITLSSLGAALLGLFLMIVATRQLPAFLEIVLLQRLNLGQGGRYTAVTLTNYLIVAVGIAWIFGRLGGSWSEIQWIFAALGVGIGFGLQEIVANFISGLIILFERPIRVGDVVTVGKTDGVVTRIRIRATTIRNWDRKELLVPNKNFITQELLNWSLSDQTTRILINLGIAYGSDVERALRIMHDATANHARIMKDPAPLVTFDEFGDNALMLSLRCYIDTIDHRLSTINDINLAINQGMNAAGIEIAFPQRDVHLYTSRPLDVRLQASEGNRSD